METNNNFSINLSKPELIPLYPVTKHNSTMIPVFNILTPSGETLSRPKIKIMRRAKYLCIKNEHNRKIELPIFLANNLMRYVNEKQWAKILDCFQVVHFLQNGNTNQKNYKLELEHTNDYKTGDAVGLVSNRGLEHSMIFLEKDLFLSKLGNNGPLIASNIKTLKEIYGTSDMAKIVLTQIKSDNLISNWLLKLKRFF